MIATELINKAKKYYDVPKRAYHNWQHVLDCLTVVPHLTNSTRFNMPMVESIQLAIAYHDAIYIPGSKVNEQASADVFLYESKGYTGTVLAKDEVVDAILATANYMSYDKNYPLITKVVLDADLHALQLPYEQFKAKQQLVADEFNAKLSLQAEFLMKTLYFKPNIHYFLSDYEAKKNIRKLFEETA